MKIMYVTLHDPKFALGGAEQILLELAGEMGKKGNEVLCLTNAGHLKDSFERCRLPVQEIPWSKLQIVPMLNRLKKAIDDFKPDLIHTFHRYPAFLLDVFLRQTHRHLYTEEVLRTDKKLWFRYGRLAAACHETVRQNLIHNYGVPESRVVTIPNAVGGREPHPEILKKIQAQFSRKQGDVWALCIGRLDKQKGHTYLIQAVAQLPPAYRQKLRVFLAGDGSLEPALKAEVLKSGCQENIIFLGHTPHIPEWLSLCDFMVLPSLWEGLPLSILEAYSLAKPVIATDIPGSRESVKNRTTGLLVPARNPEALGSALKEWIDHPEKAAQFGRHAYAWWQENFSFDRMAQSYLDLYQRLRRP